MKELIADTGEVIAIQQGDSPGPGLPGNFVVYERRADGSLGAALWDLWSYRSQQGLPPFGSVGQPTQPVQPNVPPSPAPNVNVDVVPPRPGRLIHILGGPWHPRLYSYWANAVVLRGVTYAFLGHLDGRPRFFDIRGDRVTELGTLVPYSGTTEGWYWDEAGWLYIVDGPRLMHVNPFTGESRVAFDVSGQFGNHVIWQTHSSLDGQVHSASLKELPNWNKIGTVVWYRGVLQYYPARDVLDESIITTDGEYLIILEGNGNRVVTLRTQDERYISQEDGAVGHCDCGPHEVVGEDDQHGACIVWDLQRPLTQDYRRELFRTWGMGHVSIKAGRCLLSNDEILGIVDTNNGGVHPLLNHGAHVTNDYDTQVRANLSPCGQRATYMADGEVFILEL